MHIHILGICGTFMGGIAALAREAGHTVTGCDANVYPPMSTQLEALGIALVEGFDPAQLDTLAATTGRPDVFVVGNVVSRGNPLMEHLLNARLPYTSGPAWLAQHVLNAPHAPRHVLAVAGTHGKTTTTSMLAWVLEYAGLKPGFLVGGVPQNFGVSARLGQSAPGAPFVIEADEYDTAFFDKRSKFVHYQPSTLVLNNLEFDHADIFDDLAAIERQFHHVVRTVPSGGLVVANTQASLSRVLAKGCWSGLQRFGEDESAHTPPDWTVEGEPHDFAVVFQGKAVARVQWALSGVHNQHNALAAMAAAHHVGVNPAVAAEALAQFQNVKRRMEVVGRVVKKGGANCAPITIYDDFAHHPSAIATTVDGLRRKIMLAASADKPAGRIIAVFEPRSNTMKLGTMKAQLPAALAGADLAICHSGGLDWSAEEALAPMGDKALVAHTVAQALTLVQSHAQPGDHILCMSNGSFGGLPARLVQALR